MPSLLQLRTRQTPSFELMMRRAGRYLLDFSDQWREIAMAQFTVEIDSPAILVVDANPADLHVKIRLLSR